MNEWYYPTSHSIELQVIHPLVTWATCHVALPYHLILRASLVTSDASIMGPWDQTRSLSQLEFHQEWHVQVITSMATWLHDGTCERILDLCRNFHNSVLILGAYLVVVKPECCPIKAPSVSFTGTMFHKPLQFLWGWDIGVRITQ